MGRGIQGISFLEEDLNSGKMIELPEFKGCPVYGILNNGRKVTINAKLDEETKNKLKDLGLESQIKWVCGRVDHLGKKGIDWGYFYLDKNRNSIKDSNEQIIRENKGKPLKKISNHDLYGIEESYLIRDKITINSNQLNNYKTTLYWVEPFLVHPELHFSKNPKGCFIISINTTLPDSVWVTGRNPKGEYINQILSNKKTKSKKPCLFYGDVMYLVARSLKLPGFSEINIKISNSDDNAEVFPEIIVEPVEGALNVFDDIELQEYANKIFHSAIVKIPLDVKYKPKSQKKREIDFLKIEVFHDAHKVNTAYVEPKEKDDQQLTRQNQVRIVSTAVRKKEIQHTVDNYNNSPIGGLDYNWRTFLSKTNSLIGYLPVYFQDTQNYIDQREDNVEESIKMVEKGKDSKIVSEGHSCHYTKITVQRVRGVEKDPITGTNKKGGFEIVKGGVIDFNPEIITLFDEGKRTSETDSPVIHLIAGEEPDAELKLSADLDVKGQCMEGVHSGGMDVFTISTEEARIQNLMKYKIKEKEMRLFPTYIYVKDARLPFPLNYVNPKHIKPIKYFVPIETCRYQHNVEVLVYPDIELWMEVSYNTNNKIRVNKDSDIGYAIDRLGADNDQPVIAHDDQGVIVHNDQAVFFSEVPISISDRYAFDFDVGYRYNGKEYSLQDDFMNPLKQIMSFCMSVYEFISILTSDEEVKRLTPDIIKDRGEVVKIDERIAVSPLYASNNVLSKRYEGRQKQKLPLSIELSKPSFAGALTFKYAVSKIKPNKVGYLYSFDIKANPLIKVRGSLDLLFYAQFIPAIGQALLALNRVVDRINFLTIGAVRIDYYINLGMETTFGFDFKTISYHSIDGLDLVDELKANLKLKVFIESGVNVGVSFRSIEVDVTADVKGAGYFNLNIIRSGDSLKASTQFDGVDVKVVLEFNTSGLKNDESLKSIKTGETVETSTKKQKQQKKQKARIVKLIKPQKEWPINIV